MKRRSLQVLTVLLFLCFSALPAAAHCEIPCGIYDDQARIAMLSEHTTTIEKAMQQIVELAKAKERNDNQLVRWVVNKDEHATKLQEVVSQYFMTQRIKPDDNRCTEKLTVLHKMLIAAMKCKQTTDLANVTALRGLISEFQTLYFEPAKKE